MKKFFTTLCIVFCVSIFVACGNETETTSANATSSTSGITDSSETYDIVTPVVTLKYPAMWKDVVQTEITDDGVKFTTNGTPLFDIMFKETDDGHFLGTYNGTPIYATVYEDGATDEQLEMISDINVIVDNLEADQNFVLDK